MTIYDDPNRQAVGLDPIWAPPPEIDPETTPPAYDPGAHTIAEVETYVANHPDERAAVLAAEQAGKNRTTLVASLSEVPTGSA